MANMHAPSDQLLWDLTSGIMTDNTTLGIIHSPRPPDSGHMTVGFVNTRYAKIASATVQTQSAQSRGYTTSGPVLVTPTPGSIMEPTQGFDPRIASSKQSFQYGHIAESVGITVQRLGPGVRGGEAANKPNARHKVQYDMTGSTQGQGVPMGDLGVANPNYNYLPHHHLTSCIIWDGGNGLIKARSYKYPPVWAQGNKGKYEPTFPRRRRSEICVCRCQRSAYNDQDPVSEHSIGVVASIRMLEHLDSCCML